MKSNSPSSGSFTVISGLAHQLDSPLKSILARTQKLIHDYKDRDFEFISYKVFEPFFTTKERGIDKSAGIGLSIIYSIINAAGGSIHIKSSLRKGTTMQISLPVYRSK